MAENQKKNSNFIGALIECIKRHLEGGQATIVERLLKDHQANHQVEGEPGNTYLVIRHLNEQLNVNWSSLEESIPVLETKYRLEKIDERWQFRLGALCALTTLVSVAMNLLTVAVLLRSRRGELWEYLVNLSVSDLLISFCFFRK